MVGGVNGGLTKEELSSKEQKLITILDFAEIEKSITVVSVTNIPKDREEIARAFIAKSVYNFAVNEVRKYPWGTNHKRLNR